MKLMIEMHARTVSNQFFPFRVKIFKIFVKKVGFERRTGGCQCQCSVFLVVSFFFFELSNNDDE